MSDFQYEGDTELLEKLQRNFAGKIVRKDLTKRIKEGANVPVYVLESITVIMLLLCVEDIRQKEISWWKLVILGIICLAGCVMLPDKNLWSMAGGVAIGLCMTGISMFTEGQIGMGDGIVTGLLGSMLGARGCLVMLCIASCFMAAVAVVLLICRKGGRHTTLPFVPALLGGYLTTLAVLG